MTITPQSIRDAEFKVKLRGYDKAKVQGFLDQVAEELLQCLEKLDRRQRSVEVLNQKIGIIREKSITWKKDVGEYRKTVESLTRQCREGNEKLNRQKQKLGKLHAIINRLEGEKQSVLKQLSAADSRVKEMKVGVAEERSVQNGLLQQIRKLEEQNRELRQKNNLLEEKFTNQSQQAEEVLEENQRQVEEDLYKARREVERMRDEAREELAMFPAEIQRMRAEYEQVKVRLRAIVNEYLENLENTMRVGNKLLDRDPASGEMLATTEITSQREVVSPASTRQHVDHAGPNNNPTQKKYRVVDSLTGEFELFHTIPLPEEMPFDTDYLDEISKTLFLPTD